MTKTKHPMPATIRCAIYTRKSTEEGLEQEFNSLDAQRESGESFIKSQGWLCLPDHYDDGGFTGGTMDRPALQRLLADITAGSIDCVVVYKVDRFSRSLLDFARMMETFAQHQVAFVSVTQQFNTASSMGRLVLNVLLSFAQFEREMIAERTRDKIAAARRKGKWSGGMPLLGYDVDPRGSRLLVNDREALRVRAIFKLYLRHESLIRVVGELYRRGWVNKRWTTRKGHQRGGQPFTKTTLHKLLTNPTYLGKIKYRNERHQGEHAAIVEADIWQRVQDLLRHNRKARSRPNPQGAFLKGLIRCVPCGCAMIPAHTTGNGSKKYRYYVCTRAQKRGWHSCPSKSLPAQEIERFVIDQIKSLSQDPSSLGQVQTLETTQLTAWKAEYRSLEQQLTGWQEEACTLLEKMQDVSRLAELQERIGNAQSRAMIIREHLIAAGREQQEKSGSALAIFDPGWDTLDPVEQTRIVQLLVQRVDYDGRQRKITITFHPAGIRRLADERVDQKKEISA
jgi:site-specific DNA recombinase